MPIQVKVTSPKRIKVRARIAVPENLSGVENVDTENIQDGYVLMYDNQRQRYAFMNPDALLSKAVEDNFLPQDFISKLDKDLDNLIDIDSGQF